MICIVVPAFNEGPRLPSVLAGIPPRLLGLPVATIVVSDGSTDDTERIAVEHGARLVSLPSNRGKGVALRAGLREARSLGFDYLVTMDGDGQHDPADLERLVTPVVEGRCDVAVGSRYCEDSSPGSTPLNRYLVRRALIASLRRVLGRIYTDPCCGFRCFARGAIRRIAFRGERYQGELEALFEAAANGLRVAEVPISRIYMPGASKMGAGRGRLAGRLWVVAQYVSTIRTKARELRRTGSGRPRGFGARRAGAPPRVLPARVP